MWVMILCAKRPGSLADLMNLDRCSPNLVWFLEVSPPVCFHLFFVSVFSVPSAEGRPQW